MAELNVDVYFMMGYDPIGVRHIWLEHQKKWRVGRLRESQETGYYAFGRTGAKTSIQEYFLVKWGVYIDGGRRMVYLDGDEKTLYPREVVRVEVGFGNLRPIGNRHLKTPVELKRDKPKKDELKRIELTDQELQLVMMIRKMKLEEKEAKKTVDDAEDDEFELITDCGEEEDEW